jgi:translation initiation factor 3 subunit L
MRVTSCYIALYYYMGFSLLMMRRYTDAVRTMTGVLMYLYRTQHLTRPYQYEQLNKRSEQMYKLIAICINLCPQRNVEDIVMQHLQDKYSDHLARLAKGEEAMYEELFSYAGPKIFYPGHPNYQDAANPVNAKEISQTLNQQWSVFKVDMQQQQKIPLIRSYLALYTTISTAKLASFAEGMPEDRLRAHIMALKHKHTGLIRTSKAGVAPLDGEIMSSSIVDFFLEKGVVNIADSRQAPTFVHQFIKHISKLQSLVSDLKVRS